MKRGLVALLALVALGGGVGGAAATATPELILRAEKFAALFDLDGRDPKPGDSQYLGDVLPRLRDIPPQVEAYLRRHPRDARALVVLARLRLIQIESDAVGPLTWVPAVHVDQTPHDLVIPLLDSALVIDPRLASAWFWKARILGRPAMYLKEHRMETLSWINPDNNRALPAAIRAVELAPDRPVYRELYESLLQATGRTDAEYREHPLEDEPWHAAGSLAGLDEELDQVPVPAGAVLLESSDFQTAMNEDPRSTGRGVLRTRTFAVPASAAELERHFATTWPGFAWKPVTPEDLAGNFFGELQASALTDTTNGKVRMFTSFLSRRSENGKTVLQLPWGEGGETTDGISFVVTELTGKVGGDRLGRLATIRTDPYCLLKLVNGRSLSR